MPVATLISPISKQKIEKLRVAAYCRVSSNSADQLNSYATQIRVYTNFIQKHQEWELVEVFADEGKTGTKDNRPEFQRMIHLCELRKIDLIVTKSTSRFARNTKDSLCYVQKLKKLGVGVMFEEQGINTLSLGDEMLLSTFAAIAQEESVSISQNVRLAITQRMEMGEYVNGTVPFGYRLINKVMLPYEPEAEIIRTIFDLYLQGFSTTKLVEYLEENGINGKSGTNKWNIRTVSHILSNEKYKGDTLYQKKFRETTVPFIQHINRGQEEQFYATGTHQGIIDADKFQAVQDLLTKRQTIHAKDYCKIKYPFTSRIRCAECGSFYRRRVSGGGIKWACSKHIQNGQSCNSNYYAEERIYGGFITIINKLRFGENDILGSVIQKLESASAMYKKNNASAFKMSQSIAELNAKLLMLEQLRSKGYLSPEIYQAQARDVNQQLQSLKNERQETFESRIQTVLQDVKKLKRLIDELDDVLETFNEKLFYEAVEKIEINNRDEMTVTLLGGLRFTELI